MLFASITIGLILVGFVAFLIGTVWLSKYAFRISTGTGLLTLLFPPYTFYFAFFKLEEKGAEKSTATWMFGLLTTALLAGIFVPELLNEYRNGTLTSESAATAEAEPKSQDDAETNEAGTVADKEEKEEAEGAAEAKAEEASGEEAKDQEAAADKAEGDESAEAKAEEEDGETPGKQAEADQ